MQLSIYIKLIKLIRMNNGCHIAVIGSLIRDMMHRLEYIWHGIRYRGVFGYYLREKVAPIVTRRMHGITFLLIYSC